MSSRYYSCLDHSTSQHNGNLVHVSLASDTVPSKRQVSKPSSLSYPPCWGHRSSHSKKVQSQYWHWVFLFPSLKAASDKAKELLPAALRESLDAFGSHLLFLTCLVLNTTDNGHVKNFFKVLLGQC